MTARRRAVLKEAVDAAYSLHDGKDYKTAGDMDEETQRQYLMALDFSDQIAPDMRIGNLCRARTGKKRNEEKGDQSAAGFPL